MKMHDNHWLKQIVKLVEQAQAQLLKQISTNIYTNMPTNFPILIELVAIKQMYTYI